MSNRYPKLSSAARPPECRLITRSHEGGAEKYEGTGNSVDRKQNNEWRRSLNILIFNNIKSQQQLIYPPSENNAQMWKTCAISRKAHINQVVNLSQFCSAIVIKEELGPIRT